MSTASDPLEVSQCWDHLRHTTVGRLAAVVDGAPVIRPVNFAVDHGTVLVRTDHGSLISRLAGQRVVFEADDTERIGEGGWPLAAWSVIVDGVMVAVSTTDDLVATFGVPLYPWHATPKPVFLRLEPTQVSGRWFAVAPASSWGTSFDSARHTAPE